MRQPVPGPAAEPADLPIIESGADRDRSFESEELGCQLHGPDRLGLCWQTFGKGANNWNIVSAPNFWDFEKQSHSFEAMAIFDSAGRGYNLSETRNAQEAEQVSGLRVTASFFSVLGVKPILGRTFLREEEVVGKDHEVVLGYGL